MNPVSNSHLQQAQGSAKETEQVVQIGKKRNWNSQYSTNSSNDVISTQSQHMTQSQTGDDDALQAFGETRHVLDCEAGMVHEAGLEVGSIEAAQLAEEDYTGLNVSSEAASEGGCGCHPMCPNGQQAHCHNYEHFFPDTQPSALDGVCSSDIWCSHQQSYILKASVSSEDTRMTWTEDHSTPSSGPPTDDYCCNNSCNDDSDHDNVFISQDIDTRGSTAVLRHYGSLGMATCYHNGYKELLCGGNSAENITCNGQSSNTTTQALRHLDGILRDKVNLEFDECRQSLQGILDRNLDHVQHLLQLSNDSPEIQDFEMNAQGAGLKDAAYHNSLDSYDISPRAFEDEEAEKMKCMVQLLTQASVISCSLSKKDFPA